MNADTQMARLIADNYLLLTVMSRFGIRVGFGEKSVREVCGQAGVDTETFLDIAAYIADRRLPAKSHFSSQELVDRVRSMLLFLRQSHEYILDYLMPAIRNKLLRGINLSTADVSFLILKFFDDYCGQVRTHMEGEEQTVFAYVEALLSGRRPTDYSVETYSASHHEVSSSLTELKRLILRYCPATADVNLLNDALYDIYRCEEELESHCAIEDDLFVPVVKQLQNSI